MVRQGQVATLKNPGMNSVFRQESSAKDNTRQLRGLHWVRENECFLVRLPPVPKNINYFRDLMVGAQGLEPWTRD